MSGHSKWSTIKRKKGAADAKRGIVFTRLSKDITLAAKDGGGSIDMNPALRLAIKKAKSANMPAANIDRAVKKGTGELPGIKYEDFIYEGYAPHSVAILIEVMTDNKNRTVPEIRSIMTKSGGNLGESGCVNWMFEKKGIIVIDDKKITEDQLMNLLEDIDIEDIIINDDYYEVILKPDDVPSITNILDDKNISYNGNILLNPQNFINLSEKDASQVISLIDKLEEHDDVQRVYTNLEIL